MWRFEPLVFSRVRNRKGEKESAMKSRGVNSNEEIYCSCRPQHGRSPHSHRERGGEREREVGSKLISYYSR